MENMPMRRRAGLRLVSLPALVLSSLLLTACPPSDQKASPSPSTSTCTKVGQSCEVSAGKLGTCVQKDDCKDPAGCFLCQSQH